MQEWNREIREMLSKLDFVHYNTLIYNEIYNDTSLGKKNIRNNDLSSKKTILS